MRRAQRAIAPSRCASGEQEVRPASTESTGVQLVRSPPTLRAPLERHCTGTLRTSLFLGVMLSSSSSIDCDIRTRAASVASPSFDAEPFLKNGTQKASPFRLRWLPRSLARRAMNSIPPGGIAGTSCRTLTSVDLSGSLDFVHLPSDSSTPVRTPEFRRPHRHTKKASPFGLREL